MATLADYANARRQAATAEAMRDYSGLAGAAGEYGEFLRSRLGELSQGFGSLPPLPQGQAVGGELPGMDVALEGALDQVVPQAKLSGMLAMMAKGARATPSEARWLKEIIDNPPDRVELLEAAPSFRLDDGKVYIDPSDLGGFDRYIDETVILSRGEERLPPSFYSGEIVNRLRDMSRGAK
jgi:hypothetical protein